jgi:hypothetical protein
VSSFPVSHNQPGNRRDGENDVLAARNARKEKDSLLSSLLPLPENKATERQHKECEERDSEDQMFGEIKVLV